ncbi:MAG: MBL fold metallo-hydrolase [Chloroflexota bacterium]|nr:MBL fold metallo-hydrolase [Chloroflexota bacterium]
MLEGIHWLGHASVRIDDEVVIYIDPWKVGEGKPADLILVTHAHHDHLSPEDIARLSTPETVIVCPASCVEEVSGDVRVISAGESLQIGAVLIEAVPSYNVDKPNHPKEAGNVGYVIQVGGCRIYHAGDTDLIPEMTGIQCDVAFLPAGGTYTMDADEAAQALTRIEAKVAVPIHWGDIVGSEEDAQRFKRQAPEGVQVTILEAE